MVRSNSKNKFDLNIFSQNGWFISMGCGTPGLTGNQFFGKARQIAREECFDEGELSALHMNWIKRIKNRRNLVHKNLHDEASADLTALNTLLRSKQLHLQKEWLGHNR